MTSLGMVGSLDQLLLRVCESIQLTETQYRTAVRRYERVGQHLTARETSLERFNPRIRPQGSMLQGTTVRPMRRAQEVVPYDLDTLCICDVTPQSTSSQSFYQRIRSRLELDADFKDRIRNADIACKPSGKCVRLSYVDDDFYLDVVPACIDPTDVQGVRLMIANPARWSSYASPIDTWRRTDPLRLAAWLHAQCEVRVRYSINEVRGLVRPVPPQEAADEKAPLRRIIQLLKRARDLAFLGEAVRPTSILLTAIAGRAYRGQSSVAEGLIGVLDNVAFQLRASNMAKFVVLNPADEMAPQIGNYENLAAPLDDKAWRLFAQMVGDLRQALSEARPERGPHHLAAVLGPRFGTRAVNAALSFSR